MKQIIFVLIAIFFLSCYAEDPRDTVPIPIKETTFYLHEVQKDTVLMYFEDGWLYIFDKETELLTIKTPVPKKDTTVISNWALFSLLSLMFMIIILFIYIIT
jgi:hypothetical protein